MGMPEAEEHIPSIREEQMRMYEQYEVEEEAEYDELNFGVLDHVKRSFIPHNLRSPDCVLEHEVYGYHPHWFGPAYFENYDFSLLSTFCYFSYELSPSTGGYKTIHNWKSTRSIDLAKEAGCKVELSVTNFGGYNNARFLRNETAWAKLASNLIMLLNMRDADGVNIDFEHVRHADSERFTAFVKYLKERMDFERPGMRITVALPALNYNRTYNVAALDPYVDLFIIMGYDYHYSDSKHAGPVAPLEGYVSLKSTLDHYLGFGIDRSEIILGVPYYGREWKTRSGSVPSMANAYLSSPTYAMLKDRYYQRYTERWDNKSSSPYFVRGSTGDLKQCWHENAKSLQKKYDLALQSNIGGVGIWALGYDNGYIDLWELLENNFMDCTPKGNTKAQPAGDRSLYERLLEMYEGWEQKTPKQFFIKQKARLDGRAFFVC